MLEYLKTFFPDFVKSIKSKSTFAKVVIALILLSLPILLTTTWGFRNNIHRFLLTEISINGYLIIIVLFVLLVAYLLFILFVHKTKRYYLKQFVTEWLVFRKDFGLLFSFVDVWLFRQKNQSLFEDPELWEKISTQIQMYWKSRDKLRELLFKLGESSLQIYENKHWIEIKNKANVFKERNYDTPFSFLLDLGAPIGEINLNGEAINWSLSVADEFVEHLSYKYKFIKKIVKK